MSDRYTVYVVSSTGEYLKQSTVRRSWLLAFIFLAVVLISAAGFVGYDYTHLKQTFFDNEDLRVRIHAQASEIEEQRVQIQSFVEEINDLKTRYAAIDAFEEKIRIIANIEASNGENGLFGIGGVDTSPIVNTLTPEESHGSLLREMHEQIDDLSLGVEGKSQQFEVILKSLESQRNLLACTPAIRPFQGGWISSTFGYRQSPFTSKKEFHRGLDIATKKGTPVMATADGVITFSGKKGPLGNTVVVTHGHGMVTRYGHLNEVKTKRGARVHRGDIIGTVGNTGRSTGPHLHYEVRLNGVPVNPKNYILD